MGQAAIFKIPKGGAILRHGARLQRHCFSPLLRSSNQPSPLPTADFVTGTAHVEAEQSATNLSHLGSLQPIGQLRESFILATGEDGLWIIDQHVAHERVLFENILETVWWKKYNANGY